MGNQIKKKIDKTLFTNTVLRSRPKNALTHDFFYYCGNKYH